MAEEYVDERSVGEVTAVDPLETETVKLVSGDVEVGVARPMVSDAGLPLSDLHCPLLVAEDQIVKTVVYETHVGADGEPAGRTMHRTPLQVVTDPVTCDDCGKIVERHMLVANSLTGLRRCAIAVNFEARKIDLKEILGKSPGEKVAVVDDAHPEPAVPSTAPEAAEAERERGLSFDPNQDVAGGGLSGDGVE